VGMSREFGHLQSRSLDQLVPERRRILEDYSVLAWLMSKESAGNLHACSVV
jgi:hypothetical protein